jgi:hypothetical protein
MGFLQSEVPFWYMIVMVCIIGLHAAIRYSERIARLKTTGVGDKFLRNTVHFLLDNLDVAGTFELWMRSRLDALPSDLVL